MNSHGGNGASGAEVRATLDHPVVDADGHMMECSFAVLDFVRKVGGPKIATRYENILRNDQTGASRPVFHGADLARHRRRRSI